eukprot:TRINITY_DN4597_c0_g1_i2.p3 TRINITY_DN4597_c0_g1~~TRINITY_DN4597_c0_g1_i2.p3  ORF type:complete len:170 (+),score=26.14 TRINITY_DN4597_c0_g1_i2:194-703(+)
MEIFILEQKIFNLYWIGHDFQDRSFPTINQLSEDTQDALKWAAREGNIVDTQNALQNGAQVKYEYAGGSTALHLASANGHEQVCQILLDAGSDPNAKNQNGSTPLHWAAVNNQAEVVRLLLQHGAQLTIVNSNDRTAFDEALQNNHQEVLNVMRNVEGETGNNQLQNGV